MNLTGLSKFISLILRHNPQVIGIELDEHGWADVEELLAGKLSGLTRNSGIPLTKIRP